MNLTAKQFDRILDKQCKMVGVKYKEFFKPFFDGIGMPDGWYCKHTWTSKQECEFKEWLVKYLIKTKKITRECAKRYVLWWVLDYGWKTKE